MSSPPDPGQTLPCGDRLAPCDGHRVWWCEGGDPQGIPVLIVHGGPGGASRAEPTRWFEGLPVRWLAIDQRGCGRSLPLGETAHNRLDDLLADMDRLRARLGLGGWAIAGGSWGARVALRYAAVFGPRVRGLFLRSPFLGGLDETRRYIAPWPRWLGEAGEAWLGAGAAEAVLTLYQGSTGALSGDTGSVRHLLANERVAQAWAAFDDAQSVPGGVRGQASRWSAAAMKPLGEAQAAAWRVHRHYALAGWGEADGHPRGLPTDAPACGPGTVVAGAEDATCDPALAAALAQLLPSGRSVIVPAAGHRMTDPRLAPALKAAAQDWVRELCAADGSPAAPRIAG